MFKKVVYVFIVLTIFVLSGCQAQDIDQMIDDRVNDILADRGYVTQDNIDKALSDIYVVDNFPRLTFYNDPGQDDDGHIKIYLGNGENFEDITPLIENYNTGAVCQYDKCTVYLYNPTDVLSGKQGVLYMVPVIDTAKHPNLLLNQVGGWDAKGVGVGRLWSGDKAPEYFSMPVVASWQWLGGNIKRSGITFYTFGFENDSFGSPQIDAFPIFLQMQGLSNRVDVPKSWHYGFNIEVTVPIHNLIDLSIDW